LGVGLSEMTILNCKILEYIVTFEVKGSDFGRLNNLFYHQVDSVHDVYAAAMILNQLFLSTYMWYTSIIMRKNKI